MESFKGLGVCESGGLKIKGLLFLRARVISFGHMGRSLEVAASGVRMEAPGA